MLNIWLKKEKNIDLLPVLYQGSCLRKSQHKETHIMHQGNGDSLWPKTKQRSISLKLPHKMGEDTDHSGRVTFENNLSGGGLRQKAMVQVKLHLTLSWGQLKCQVSPKHNS